MKKRLIAIFLAAMLILTMPMITFGCPGTGGDSGSPPCDRSGLLRIYIPCEICIPCDGYDYPVKPEDTPQTIKGPTPLCDGLFFYTNIQDA